MNNDTLVIERVLSLKDQSPFILIQDNFTQSSKLLINEILTRCSFLRSKLNFNNASCFTNIGNLIYLGYETPFIPGYIREDDLFIDCLSEDGDTEFGICSIIQKVEQYLNESIHASCPQETINTSPSKENDLEMTSKSSILQVLNQNTSQKKKTLIIIDSLNYIKFSSLVSALLSGLAQLNRNNNLTIIATLHGSIVETSLVLNSNANEISLYPSKENLLNFLATTVLNVNYYFENNPSSIDEEQINSDFKGRFYPSLQLNKYIFEVNLIKFKKTGKKVQYDFVIDTDSHKIVLRKGLQKTENDQAEKNEEDLLRGLSTFNLNTSLKQQKAREQVDLPFLDAQSFQNGGAIVYQFEKDDDYDEEDPYEDPF